MAESLLIKISNPYPVSHEAIVSLAPGQRIQIGRSEDNDVIVLNDYVSRNHLMLFWDDGKVFVRDLKSLNGVVLNGKRIKDDSEFKVGDQIELSNVKIALLPGLGKTQAVPSETIAAAKSGSRISSFPEGTIESSMTLKSDAPVKGKPFVKTPLHPEKVKRTTLWKPGDSETYVREARKGKKTSLMIPLLLGIALAAIYSLFF